MTRLLELVAGVAGWLVIGGTLALGLAGGWG